MGSYENNKLICKFEIEMNMYPDPLSMNINLDVQTCRKTQSITPLC